MSNQDQPSRKTCDHYWLYPHAVFQGQGKNGIAVVRVCAKCKKSEMAFAGAWGRVPTDYDITDVLDQALEGVPVLR